METDFKYLEVDELWVDHSNATPWEDLISAFESAFSKWNITDTTTTLTTTLEETQGEPEELKNVKKKVAPSVRVEKEDLLFDGEKIGTVALWVESLSVIIDKSMWRNKVFEHFTAVSFSILNVNGDPQKDFPVGSEAQYPFRRWFGIEEYMVVEVKERTAGSTFREALGSLLSRENVTNPDTVNFFLSTASIALSNANTSIPLFIPYRSSNLGVSYKGICVPGSIHGGATLYFEADIFAPEDADLYIPVSFRNLSGWTQIFKKKLQLDTVLQRSSKRSNLKNGSNESKLLQGDIFISMRRTYCMSSNDLKNPRKFQILADELGWSEWVDDDVSWRYRNKNLSFTYKHPVTRALEGSTGVPLWGPLKDPMKGFQLHIVWPFFREGTYIENSVFSNMNARTAPLWILEILFSDSVKLRSDIDNSFIPNKTERNCPEGAIDDADHALTPLASTMNVLMCLVQDAESICSDFLLSSFAADTLDNRRTFIFEGEATTEIDNGVEVSDGFAHEDFTRDNPDAFLRADTLSQNKEWTPIPTRKIRRRVHEMIIELFLWEKKGSNRRFGFEESISHSKQFQMLLDSDIHETRKRDSKTVRETIHEKLLQQKNEFDKSGGCQIGCHYVPPSHCRFCNPCMIRKHSVCSSRKDSLRTATKRLGSAPPGSLLSVLALRLIPEFGTSLSAVALLWRELISEIRWHWENSIPIPLTAAQRILLDPCEQNLEGDCGEKASADQSFLLYPGINHADSIIHQKLQHLNLCILRKIHEESHVLSNEQECGCFQDSSEPVDTREHDSSDGDSFFDARNESDSEDDDDGLFSKRVQIQYYANTLETLDTFMDRQHMVSKHPDMRTSLLYKHILSDASAYKAEYPSCKRADFISWAISAYSLNQSESERKEEATTLESVLSSKSWDEISPACLFSQDAGKFNAFSEAEKILHYLETISPSDCMLQLFRIGAISASFVLENAETQATKLSTLRRAMSSMNKNIRFSLEDMAKRSRCSRLFDHEKNQMEKVVECAQLNTVMNEIKLCEELLTKCTSLMNQFPFNTVEKIMLNKSNTVRGSASFVMVLDESDSQVRSQVVHSLVRDVKKPYDTNQDGRSYLEDLKKLKQPKSEEIVMRCLATKPCIKIPPGNISSSSPCGANRMYVSTSSSAVRIATVFTENSF